MRVRVRLFAGTREAAGVPHVELDLPEGARVADVWPRLIAASPQLARYQGHALMAVDGAIASESAPLRAGAVVALLPPVSGGAVQEGPFSLDDISARLRKDGAGAVVAFVGIVRPTSAEAPGAKVERLHFEAYAEMAARELDRVKAEAIAKFALIDCIIVHRIGTLPVGEPIVAVATSAAHRRAAFEAATWVMDELKASVPIWKQEQDASGATRWVNDVRR